MEWFKSFLTSKSNRKSKFKHIFISYVNRYALELIEKSHKNRSQSRKNCQPESVALAAKGEEGELTLYYCTLVHSGRFLSPAGIFLCNFDTVNPQIVQILGPEICCTNWNLHCLNYLCFKWKNLQYIKVYRHTFLRCGAKFFSSMSMVALFEVTLCKGLL